MRQIGDIRCVFPKRRKNMSQIPPSYWQEPMPTAAAARNLYEKLGFVEVGRRRNYYEHPREDAVIMTRENFDHVEATES